MKSDRSKNWPKDERPREKLLAEGAEKQESPTLFTTPAGRVVALEIERTFWEKATILHKGCKSAGVLTARCQPTTK